MGDVKVTWPNGKTHAKLVNQVRRNKKIITEGKVLAIDPASGKTSCPGYSYWVGGELQEFGDIKVDSKYTIQKRLAEIVDVLVDSFPDVDVLVIEQIRGRSVQPSLFWSIGAVMSHIRTPVFLEVPLWTWKAMAKSIPQYKKADDLDAVLIGGSVMHLAGLTSNWLEGY